MCLPVRDVSRGCGVTGHPLDQEATVADDPEVSLEVLRGLIAEYGEPVPPAIPARLPSIVTVEEVAACCSTPSSGSSS